MRGLLVVFVVLVTGCRSEESVCEDGQEMHRGCSLTLCGMPTTGKQVCNHGQWSACQEYTPLGKFCPEPMVPQGGLCVCPEEKPAEATEEPVAQLTCMPPWDDGTIICHIGAEDSFEGARYDCRVDQSRCYGGFAKTLRREHGREQTCLGAVVCTPAVPQE